MRELNDTAQRVLDIAELYTQMRGFNAFSYKDIQAEVGVKTSSIHYYFPTKQDLADRMIERYTARFSGVLDRIASQHEQGLARLRGLGQVYIDTVSSGKFCLCGMLASDMLSLPDSVMGKVNRFFDLIEAWVKDAIVLAQAQDSVMNSVEAKRAASHFLAALEGGMLIARTQKRPEYLEVVVNEAVTRLARP